MLRLTNVANFRTRPYQPMNHIHIYTDVKRQSFNELAETIGRRVWNKSVLFCTRVQNVDGAVQWTWSGSASKKSRKTDSGNTGKSKAAGECQPLKDYSQ